MTDQMTTPDDKDKELRDKLAAIELAKYSSIPYELQSSDVKNEVLKHVDRYWPLIVAERERYSLKAYTKCNDLISRAIEIVKSINSEKAQELAALQKELEKL